MRLGLTFLSFALAANAAKYWVSPNGDNSWNGSYRYPWRISKVCSGVENPSPIAPGDTIYVRGGEYIISSALACRLKGTESNRIRIVAAPGETPVFVYTYRKSGNGIDFSYSEYLDVIGIAFVYKMPQVNYYGVSNPLNINVPAGAGVVLAVGFRLINCIILGLADALGGATTSDSGTLWYGNIAWRNGGDAPDRGHGDAGYSQNRIDRPQEVYENNILLRGWRTHHQYYGSAVDRVQNFTIRKNLYGTNVIIGGYGDPGPMYGIVVEDNMFMFPPSLQYGASQPTGAIFNRNMVASSIYIGLMSGGEVKNNIINGELSVSTRSGGDPVDVDGNITVTATGTWYVMWPNEFEVGRAHIGIKHWSGTKRVMISLDQIVERGETIEIIDAYNPLEPIATMTYNGPFEWDLVDVEPWSNGIPDDACWHVDRANCLTSGDYVAADVVQNLRPGQKLYELALTSSDWKVHYWNGNQWVATGATMTTHGKPDNFQRIPGFYPLVVRKSRRKSPWVRIVWSQSEGTSIEVGQKNAAGQFIADGEVVEGPTCSNGVCEAVALTIGGRAWWRVNGGPLRVAKAL